MLLPKYYAGSRNNLPGSGVARRSRSETGGRHWALGAMPIQTAKFNDVEPLAWLPGVLKRIVPGQTKRNQLNTLPRWNWKWQEQFQPVGSGQPSNADVGFALHLPIIDSSEFKLKLTEIVGHSLGNLCAVRIQRNIAKPNVLRGWPL